MVKSDQKIMPLFQLKLLHCKYIFDQRQKMHFSKLSPGTSPRDKNKVLDALLNAIKMLCTMCAQLNVQSTSGAEEELGRNYIQPDPFFYLHSGQEGVNYLYLNFF